MSISDLGPFLKARRGRVQPADVGLNGRATRRVPGLRREEVAMLAGVSVDYYARLEQGRERNPSPSVLNADRRRPVPRPRPTRTPLPPGRPRAHRPDSSLRGAAALAAGPPRDVATHACGHHRPAARRAGAQRSGRRPLLRLRPHRQRGAHDVPRSGRCRLLRPLGPGRGILRGQPASGPGTPGLRRRGAPTGSPTLRRQRRVPPPVGQARRRGRHTTPRRSANATSATSSSTTTRSTSRARPATS